MGLKWWEALEGETDECIGRVCIKMGHFKSKLGVVGGQE